MMKMHAGKLGHILMRYRVINRIIRSENAAKPVSQSSKFILGEMKQLRKVENSLDYGSGKLRYLEPVFKTSTKVWILDSQIQMERDQMIFGEKRSVTNFVRSSNRVSIFPKITAYREANFFDRAFCLNVLSAIPILTIRWNVLKNCFRLLKSGGEFVVSHQYRNSDFSRMRNMKNSFKFRDGFIVDSLRGSSFYSTFGVDTLVKKLDEVGFTDLKIKRNDGTILIVAYKG